MCPGVSGTRSRVHVSVCPVPYRGTHGNGHVQFCLKRWYKKCEGLMRSRLSIPKREPSSGSSDLKEVGTSCSTCLKGFGNQDVSGDVLQTVVGTVTTIS